MDKVLKGEDGSRAFQVKITTWTRHGGGTQSEEREGRQGAKGLTERDEGRRLAANSLSRLDHGQLGMPSKGVKTRSASTGDPPKMPE